MELALIKHKCTNIEWQKQQPQLETKTIRRDMQLFGFDGDAWLSRHSYTVFFCIYLFE